MHLNASIISVQISFACQPTIGVAIITNIHLDNKCFPVPLV